MGLARSTFYAEPQVQRGQLRSCRFKRRFSRLP